MTVEHPSRRTVLKTTVALSTAASLGVAPGHGQDRSATPLGRLDAVLRAATEARDAPGLVAMAATDKDILYEGVFGSRNLATGETMTRDTVFRIASMTKAVTSTAVLQLVEQGKLQLEDAVPNIDPALGSPQVLEGFDASGAPKLRPAKRPITLRHLLTHTAGFCYEVWDGDMVRYVKATGMPSTPTGKVASIRMPLVFDPGERWEYGVNIDWVGRIIESASGKPLDAYFRDHIFGPLGMTDTDYVFSPQQEARLVSVHQRKPDGSLEPQPLTAPFTPEFRSGGGGLYSTAADYLTFARMLLLGGSINGTRILKPETVALMNRNQIGDIEAGRLKTTAPERSTDVDFFPGQSLRWGLGYMITVQQGPNGRSPGTVTWAGIFNTHYWIDPARRVTGVIMMQVLPFGDPRAMKVYGQFERGVYDLLKSA
jgi:CubicO group peptidase (beta-lactamase class C family)